MTEEIIGLIPAAGQAMRISPLPGSKEIFPIGFREMMVNGNQELRPKVVSQYLLDNMFNAGASKIWMVLRKGKWDIAQYYGDGLEYGGQIAYLVTERLWGMPFTLNQAFPFLGDATVLFGMPDTIFTPADAFARMVVFHRQMHADVTLGIFPTDRPTKLCVVDLNDDGKVLSMVDKPAQTHLRSAWGSACWSSRFSCFMNDYLQKRTPPEHEVVQAEVFLAAMKAGLVVNGVNFIEGEYIDIGTPDDLIKAVHRFSSLL